MSDSKPTLWHIDVSHYSEKVRWALAHKEIGHRRRAPVPGAHIPIALWLTSGSQATFPVLTLDGRAVGDSTAIIAALEQRYPDPPLYPADPEQRRRALTLEDYFDTQLGPQIRLLAWHEFGNDRERFAQLMTYVAPGPLAMMSGVAASYGRAFTNLRYRVRDPKAAERARAEVLVALDRLEEELGENEYLVGNSFTVADLTGASLFYPLVLPDEGPLPTELTPPAGFERFREPLKERRGFKWVAEMFRRHRKPAARQADAPAPPARAGAE